MSGSPGVKTCSRSPSIAEKVEYLTARGWIRVGRLWEHLVCEWPWPFLDAYDFTREAEDGKEGPTYAAFRGEQPRRKAQ